MRKQTIWAAALAALALAGCRKDLCYNHDEHALNARVLVEAEWEREWEYAEQTAWEEAWDERWREYDSLRPDVASGIRSVVYRRTGGVAEYNHRPSGGLLPLTEGTHSILFYNNDTEYIVFDNVSESASATASTRSRSRANYEPLHEGERTVNAPDMLYGAYVEEYRAERRADTARLPVVMRPLVVTYLVCYEFESGLKYVALARGALAGMAESVYLNDGHTGGETATVLFDETEITDWGVMAEVRSFGAPNHPHHPDPDYGRAGEAEEARYTLNLELRLKNGKMLPPFNFDVTEQVEAQPRGGVIVVSGIVVSDEDGTEGGGAFDVDVEGWGDYVDIPLPLD